MVFTFLLILEGFSDSDSELFDEVVLRDEYLLEPGILILQHDYFSFALEPAGQTIL